MNFKEIDWGKDEAKNDEGLRDYFVEFDDFKKVRTGEKRYVIGRKGTGKTAIIERIRIESNEKNNSFNKYLSLKDFPLQDLISLKDKSFRDKSQFVQVWTFLLYIELAKMICADPASKESTAKDNLVFFLKLNNLNSEIGFSNTINELKNNQSKIKLDAKWISAEESDTIERSNTVSVHYNKVSAILEEKIKAIQSTSEYWILIDELDEGYRHGDTSLRLILLALLRAVENTALHMKNAKTTYRPLLVMRSDIFDRLEDNDLNKLDDFIIRLNWTSTSTESNYALKSIVNARIIKSLGESNDPWASVVYDTDIELPAQVDSIWNYMVNRTYERPRDILKFLKICSQNCSSQKLNFTFVSSAETKYSHWLYNEIRDEIHSYLDCWNHSINCITKIGYGKIKKQEIVNKLENDRMTSGWMRQNSKSPDDILETLFDFGIIGNLTSDGRWLFKYKDHDLTYDEDSDIIIHYGLSKKLRIKGGRE